MEFCRHCCGKFFAKIFVTVYCTLFSLLLNWNIYNIKYMNKTQMHPMKSFVEMWNTIFEMYIYKIFSLVLSWLVGEFFFSLFLLTFYSGCINSWNIKNHIHNINYRRNVCEINWNICRLLQNWFENSGLSKYNPFVLCLSLYCTVCALHTHTHTLTNRDVLQDPQVSNNNMNVSYTRLHATVLNWINHNRWENSKL